MIYHSKRKVGKGKRMFINVLYGFGIKVNKIVSLTGVSRATVYRHSKDGKSDRYGKRYL